MLCVLPAPQLASSKSFSQTLALDALQVSFSFWTVHSRHHRRHCPDGPEVFCIFIFFTLPQGLSLKFKLCLEYLNFYTTVNDMYVICNITNPPTLVTLAYWIHSTSQLLKVLNILPSRDFLFFSSWQKHFHRVSTLDPKHGGSFVGRRSILLPDLCWGDFDFQWWSVLRYRKFFLMEH